MKGFTKIVSALMASAMLISAAGCNLFGGSKIGPSALANYAKGQDADFYDDADDFFDLVDDLNGDADNIKKIKNGVYVTLEGKDLKSFFKASRIGGTAGSSFSYDKSMVSGTVYYIGAKKNDKQWALMSFSLEFETEEDAEDYFDDSIDQCETGIRQLGLSLDTDEDDGEENGISYYIANATSSSQGIYEGIYRDGKNVLFLLAADVGGKDASKTIEAICEEFGIISPKDA